MSRQEDHLLILADLEDHCVTKTRFPFNYPAFLESDVFEIFLMPDGSRTYHEVHVSPSNSIFQLELTTGTPSRSFMENLIKTPLLTSITQITKRGWQVYVRVPGFFAVFFEKFHFSFCRYDYTVGHKEPVLSSTSPHIICDFHRISEWRSILVNQLPVIPADQ